MLRESINAMDLGNMMYQLFEDFSNSHGSSKITDDDEGIFELLVERRLILENILY